MRKRLVSACVGGLVLSLCLCVMPLAAKTASDFTATSGASTIIKPKKLQAPKMPRDKSGSENSAQRDKRLLRECRGRPNAGACEGYAN
jgi:hypothetical protein